MKSHANEILLQKHSTFSVSFFPPPYTALILIAHDYLRACDNFGISLCKAHGFCLIFGNLYR